MSRMTVLCVETSHRNNNHNSKHKDDTINVTKAAVRKSILMQITTKAKAANGFLSVGSVHVHLPRSPDLRKW
jgi:hypothetical protein